MLVSDSVGKEKELTCESSESKLTLFMARLASIKALFTEELRWSNTLGLDNKAPSTPRVLIPAASSNACRRC